MLLIELGVGTASENLQYDFMRRLGNVSQGSTVSEFIISSTNLMQVYQSLCCYYHFTNVVGDVFNTIFNLITLPIQ